MKILLSSELQNFKHLKDAQRMFPEVSISTDNKQGKKASLINSLSLKQEIINQEKKPKMNILGVKKKSNQAFNPDYKFVYRYNEGVTNKVSKALNLNEYFFGPKKF